MCCRCFSFGVVWVITGLYGPSFNFVQILVGLPPTVRLYFIKYTAGGGSSYRIAREGIEACDHFSEKHPCKRYCSGGDVFVVSVKMYLFLVEHYLFIRQAVNNERSSRCHTVEGFCSLSANLIIYFG